MRRVRFDSEGMSDNFLLDCETGDSAIESLCSAFSCSTETLSRLLFSIDIDAVYKKHWRDINVPAEEYLYSYAVQRLGPHKPLRAVCWFHLTRTLKDNDFNSGIWPLGKSLDSVWDMMISIPQDRMVRERLLQMRKSRSVADWQYSMKSKDPVHWGPYGILVKDVAFCAKDLGQHDYLGMPEIIEDICNGYNAQHGESISEIYSNALIPKIVKFKSSHRLDSRCVEAAISYVYTHIRKQPPCCWSVTCFDGAGVTISTEDILSVGRVG